MISKETLEETWLKEVASGNRRAGKHLVEKVSRALLLVKGLQEADVPFVFKGGTALMLMLGSRNRLSIDIDIAMSDRSLSREVLQEIAAEKGFKECVPNERLPKEGVDKEHFKFHFAPVLNPDVPDDNVLLDIVYGDHHYDNVISTSLESQFLRVTGNPISLKTPSLENLVGDKLTAFAPNTTGILYTDEREMQIIKQLYDVGSAFDEIRNVEEVANTFRRTALHQMKIRNLGSDVKTVTDDILSSALTLGIRGKENPKQFAMLSSGIDRLRGHIFSETFNIERAIRDAAKAAYLAKLIETGRTTFDRVDDLKSVKGLVIGEPLDPALNNLRSSNPEAFFYWYKIFELEK